MAIEIDRPLRLTALTVRGIGPYYLGGRLEIAPLTILCGANGSGKSTWIKVLDLLRLSAERDSLEYPFPCHIKAPEQRTLEEFGSSEADLRHLVSEDSDIAYGPPGTIGVECVVDRPFCLQDINPAMRDTRPWTNRWKQGSKLRFRLTYPEICPGASRSIELSVDDAVVYRRVYAPSPRSEARNEIWWNILFFAGSDEPVEPHALVHLWHPPDEDGVYSDTPDLTAWVEQGIGSETLENVRQSLSDSQDWFFNFVQALIREVLAGVFCLGAVRNMLQGRDAWTATGKSRDEEDHVRRRDVGVDGSMTYPVFEEFNACAMVQGFPPFDGVVDSPMDFSHCEDAMAAFRTSMGLDEEAPIEPYNFITFVRFWMKHLLDINLAYQAYQELRVDGFDGEVFRESWLREDTKPSGYLLGPPLPIPLSGPDPRLICEHPCVKVGRLSQMSAGALQILPIIVQSGVMRKNEVLCLENPEAHLHPSLQTKLCEFLISQARCGKVLLIETHSDLFVYRVLRAILEEAIPQAAVRIHFTHLETRPAPCNGDAPASSTVTFSKVEQIQIDDRGRVANWPTGFLDEDMQEFGRLMNAMPPDEDEEE